MSETRQIAEKITIIDFIDTKPHAECFPKVIQRQQEKLKNYNFP